MKGKRGSEKYYIIMSLILGILVLGISLYFIFHEYFTQDDIDWEACRQSIYLRQLMPTSERPITNKLDMLKEMIPLKCRTEVLKLEIDPDAEAGDEVANAAMKVMADRMVQCFRLFGEGEYKLFPVNFLKFSQDCSICARIDFDEEFENRGYTFNFIDYLWGHNLEGEPILSGDRNTVSYGKFLGVQVSSRDRLVFLTKETNNCGVNSCEYGQKSSPIDPSDGDLLIGMYFYSNREAFDNLNLRLDFWNAFRSSKYQWSKPFYTQVGDPALGPCDIRSIPA